MPMAIGLNANKATKLVYNKENINTTAPIAPKACKNHYVHLYIYVCTNIHVHKTKTYNSDSNFTTKHFTDPNYLKNCTGRAAVHL